MSGEMRVDLSRLQTFVKGLDDKHVVKVGIFGSHNGRSGKAKSKGLTNAEVGAKHEFGSFSDHMPVRSFLRFPLTLKADDVLKEVAVGFLALLAQGKMVQILKRLGIACENTIQRAFDTGGFGIWKPNAESTVRRKGSAAILIDTAQLRRSIASKVEAQ